MVTAVVILFYLVAVAAAVEKLLRQQRLEDALKFFDEAVEDKQVEGKHLLYRSLFDGFSFCGQLDRAKKHVEEKVGWTMEWPPVLARRYAKDLEVARAMEVCQEILRRGYPVNTQMMSSIILANAENGNVDGMIEVSQRSKGFPVRSLYTGSAIFRSSP